MSMPRRPRQRERSLIRRGVRVPTTIELPLAPKPQSLPHPGKHAQTFALALLVVIAIGTGLLSLPVTTQTGRATPMVDALFTAVSAVAVTGLVTVDTVTHWNLLGQVVILILIQIGGLGFMVGASIVLQVLRRGSNRLSDNLLMREGGPTVSLHEAGLLARRIALFTLATEGVGALVLTLRFAQEMPVPQAAWFGLFHAISAFCNAGFDLQGGFVSLIPYQDSLIINATIMLLIQAGALSYLVLADVVSSRRWRRLAVDSKLVLSVNAILLLGGTLAFLVIEWNGILTQVAPGLRPLVALFQSVTARTAGFATVNFGALQAETLFIWMALMFIGGASGSTAGGVKLSTVGVIAAALASTLTGGTRTQAFQRRIPTELVFRAMAVVAIMLSIHFVATAALVASQRIFDGADLPFVTLMFEAMSALATVGLSTGITPALENAGKLILAALMVIGRLGPLTVVYALQKRQRRHELRYATTSVRIG
jgi:trk system potassium uptake protein TrkH